MSSIDLIRGFQTLGCQDEMKCAVASIVYQDLEDDESDLQQNYDKEFDLIYFCVKKDGAELKIIVPTASCNELDLNKMAEIQQKLDSKGKSVTIAICDPNSTILYYQITNDFVEKY